MSGNRKSYLAQLALVAAFALPLGIWPPAAPAQNAPTTQVTVGEPIHDVEAALHIDQRPSKAPTTGELPETQIHLPERGIWIFFDPENRAAQFRFDAPFSGNIDGARIGDSMQQVQAALGSPLRSIPSLSGPSYLYRPENGTVIRCDFDTRGMLQTIRVLGGAIAFIESQSERVPVPPADGPIAPIVTTHGHITNLTIPGSLAVTQELACVKLEDVNRTATPPDLYAAIPRCLAENRYEDAVALFALAGAEASFDAQRVTDRTAGQARQVLIMNTFSRLPPAQRQRFGEAFKAIIANPRELAGICARMGKIAPPSYYPRYMILHGIRAFQGDPYRNALVAHFDAEGTWIQIQRKYLNCPTAR